VYVCVKLPQIIFIVPELRCCSPVSIF